VSREIVRGLSRVAVLGALVIVCLLFRASETDSGNRTFLLVLAALLGAVACWSVVETCLSARRVRRFGR
jgi:DMSO reductase anchor subunit